MAKNILLPDVVCKVEKSGNRFNAWSTDGVKYTSEITHGCRKNAFNGDYLIGRFPSTNGNKGYAWRRVTDKVMAAMGEIPSGNSVETVSSVEVPSDHAEVLNFIHSSYSLKPKGLMMSELKWKYLIRSAVRGKNIMMTGPAGCGKTMAAKAVVNSLDRPDFYFNLGATQDPRGTLIGNTHFEKNKGTYFSESLFVEAIQTPNAVILLDELSRAHPDAWNILMTVLDYGQRYLRLDEQDNQATIKVADGVTFVATANIGNEYTSTRVMDKALMDRFTIVEMDVLSEDDETTLLNYMFPHVDSNLLSSVAKIATLTRTESNSDTARITSGVSTRTTVELCGLLYDGFSLEEAAEVSIYPQYDATGGVDSERTFVKQIVQKFCDDGSSDDLFNEEEMAEAEDNTQS
jgi:nitric oxide reductase NorQ protein